MQNKTDNQSRLVLDLGYSKTNVQIDEIALYELNFATESQDTVVQTSFFFPNPTDGLVNFSTADSASVISVYSFQGSLVWEQQMPSSQQINLKRLPAGRYIIRWQAKERMQVGKLIKQASLQF
nr:T9SS type A sorting domain-containing protein [Sunxiuqinia sp.]